MNSELLPPPLNAHKDPITGEAGCHPVATGIGAATVGTLGLVIAGTLAGPVGLAAALVGGAMIGAYTGTAVGEVVAAEEEYWHKRHMQRWFGDQDAA